MNTIQVIISAFEIGSAELAPVYFVTEVLRRKGIPAMWFSDRPDHITVATGSLKVVKRMAFDDYSFTWTEGHLIQKAINIYGIEAESNKAKATKEIKVSQPLRRKFKCI